MSKHQIKTGTILSDRGLPASTVRGPAAILGTGRMARGLARRLAGTLPGGIVLGSRDTGRAAEVAATLNHADISGADVATAARGAPILVLAVPFAAAAAVLAAAGPLDGKVIVDITNPITPDYMALTIGHTTSAAEEIQMHAPGAKVVKAFNTIFAEVFDRDVAPEPAGGVPVFYAGDDAAAKGTVAALIRAAGFAPVHAGSLKNARYLEPLGELNIHLGYALGWGTVIAPAWITLSAEGDGPAGVVP